MQFNSYIFILVFLPLAVILYFSVRMLKPVYGKLVLITAGLIFYGCGGYEMLALLLVSMIINYLSALVIHRRGPGHRVLTVLPVIVNVGSLLYFKYYNFLIINLNAFTGKDLSVRDILLPLGISFYTFQQIAYLAAVSKGELERTDLLDYMVFILFFPKLLMGPLMEPAEFISQINDETRRKPDAKNIAAGLRLFSAGLIKKTLFADTFALAVSRVYADIFTATSMDCILLMLFYTFEIYFDFSGYSDMAAGISAMLNIDLPMNFDSPYKALSVSDFWKRWHISLTGFLTKYIYIPLGGSRKGRVRTYINILTVFLISGLWHGANWTFILWGLIHGLLMCLDRAFGKIEERIFRPVRWAVTFIMINILWLLFSAGSVELWYMILKKAVSVRGWTVSSDLISRFPFTGTVWEMAIFLAASFFICLVPENIFRNKERSDTKSLVLAVVSFVFGLLCVGSESVFLYFGF